MAIKYQPCKNSKLVISFTNGEKGGVFLVKQLPALMSSMFIADYLFGNKKELTCTGQISTKNSNLKKL